MSRGLCDRIKNAKHPKEFDEIAKLALSDEYRGASDKTKRRWVRLSNLAIKRFESMGIKS